MTLNGVSDISENINEPTELITIRHKSNKKRKCPTEDLLEKAYSVLSEKEDDNDVFGKFVTSELRGLQSDHLRKKAKRQIQRILLDIAEEDDGNMSTSRLIPVPTSSFSSTSSNSGYNTISAYNNSDYNYIVSQAVTDNSNVLNTFDTDIP